MNALLKQSTAATVVLGPFVDSTDGVTAETALSIVQATVRLSKIGGAFAQKSSAVAATHMENGYYLVTLNATDTATLGELVLAISASGALPVWRTFTVVPANVYESLVLGTEWLETTGLRADFTISGTTLTVKKTDGTTNQYTQTLTTDAAAVPVVGAS